MLKVATCGELALAVSCLHIRYDCISRTTLIQSVLHCLHLHLHRHLAFYHVHMKSIKSTTYCKRHFKEQTLCTRRKMRILVTIDSDSDGYQQWRKDGCKVEEDGDDDRDTDLYIK